MGSSVPVTISSTSNLLSLLSTPLSLSKVHGCSCHLLPHQQAQMPVQLPHPPGGHHTPCCCNPVRCYDQAWRGLWTHLEHFSVFYTFSFLYFSPAHVLEHSFLPAQVLMSPKFIQFTVWLPRTHIPLGRSSLHLQASPLHDLPLSPQISMSTGMPSFCPDRLPSTSTLTLYMIITHLGATFESSLWDFTLYSVQLQTCAFLSPCSL